MTPQPDSKGEFASPLDGALFMASLGVPQTPLRPRTKIAFLEAWQEKTSTNPEQIKAWAREYPNCNFGSVAFPQGIFIFEVDAPTVRERYKVASGKEFTSGFVVESRQGAGRGHRYYKWVAGVENIAQSDTKHGDFSVRADRAYCVSAGSVNPETAKQYRIARKRALTEPTAEEIAFWKSEKNSSEKKTAPAEDAPIPQGRRNSTLTSIGGSLRAKGLNRDEIDGVLQRMNEERCEPQMSTEEVSGIADSVSKYAVKDESVLIGGKIAGARKTVEAEEAALEAEAATIPYHIVGADKESLGSDVLLVFPTVEESDMAQRLGFNAVAVLDGNANGDAPFQPSLTMLKIKYDHVAVFGQTDATAFFARSIGQGATVVDYPPDLSKPKRANRRSYPKFSTLVDAVESDSEWGVQTYLDSVVKMDAVTGTANTIQRTMQDVKDKINSALDKGKKLVSMAEPRIVVSSVIEDLRRLQFYDNSSPKPLTENSLWGVLGEFVSLAYPRTVASREMLLYEMLPLIGVMLGDAYYRPYGSNKHFPSLFTLTIARTADGKGQVKDLCESAIEAVDADWKKSNFFDIPASGEGLTRILAGSSLIMDGRRKRVAFVIPEMSAAFNVRARENSTLSECLLKMYDGDRLQNIRSTARVSSTADFYLTGLAGTITPTVLREVMPKMDWTNGCANRFLWNVGGSDKRLSRSSAPDFKQWGQKIRKLIGLNFGGKTSPIEYSREGETFWDEWYNSLPEHNDDVLSDSQQRAPANCARLANLYAQLDERRLDGWQPVLEPRHIAAGIEIVARSRQSVEWYLAQQNVTSESGASYEDIMKLKAAVLAAMRETGVAELTTNDVKNLFNNKAQGWRDELCLRAGLKARQKARQQGGKPVTVWTWAD